MNTQTILIIVGLGMALTGIYLLFPVARRILQIRRTPTTWISALPGEGCVEVAGTAGPMTMQSPVSKTPCVLWQIEVKEEKRGSKGERHWDTVLKESSSDPFEISDETGKIVVQPQGADLIVQETSVQSGSEAEEACQNLGISTKGFLGFGKRMRVSERLILPGGTVYVSGALLADSGNKSIGQAPGSRLVISDRDEASLLKSLYLDGGLKALLILGGAALILAAALRFIK